MCLSQIFVPGFVHGDLPPGNVLVRASPVNGKHEVVVLDHGLYMEESEDFRRQNCALWKAMVLMDVDTLKTICTTWGIKDYELFASIQVNGVESWLRQSGRGIMCKQDALLEGG